MKIWHKFHIFAPKIGQNPENALAKKIRLEFRIPAPPEPVNTWNPAKSRNSTADENLGQISHFCPQNRAKSRKWTSDENSARITHCCTSLTCKHLKSGKIQKFHCRWKYGSNFTFLHTKIVQNPENALAMKIRLEFRILAPPGPVNTWNPAKSRNSTADENLGQISHFCQQNRAKSRKWTRDENSARITNSCTSRTCKHLKSGKIQKFHCRWKFSSNFTFLPPKLGKIKKMHSRWKFGSNFAFLHFPDMQTLEILAKSRNSTADENLAQISHFLPQNWAKSKKCTRDENSAQISHSCTSRSCKHLKSGKIQKFHWWWKFGTNFTFLPPKSGKIQKMHLRWKFGSYFAFLHLPEL